MKDINDTMQEVHAKKEQKKRLQRMKKRKEQKDAKVANARRCFMLGEAVCEYFPDMQKCHLQYNAPEIDDAFREFRAILELLSKDDKLLGSIKERAVSNGREEVDMINDC